jgi:dihydroorotate dehydrogenase electron transfer subunit
MIAARLRSQFVSHVASNTLLCREHYRLVLRVASFPPTEPGQFLQISCRPSDAEEDAEVDHAWTEGRLPSLLGSDVRAANAVLRRPFSLAGRRDTQDGVELDIIHRVVGLGTDWLSKLAAGDEVHLLGPLGNRFPLPSRHVPALLVGGGVGIPPMLYLAQRLAGHEAVAFCGATTRELLPLTVENSTGISLENSVHPELLVQEFARHGIPSIITTDDGSFGFRGFVTQALEKYLDAAPAGVKPVIYTCGPEPMMKRVADIASARGLDCQIAVERAMACGMGTCQSCVIKVRRPSIAGRDWVYRLACTDGPIFSGDHLLW